MKNLPDKYDHKLAEKKWQETWEKKGVYHWDNNSTRADSYVIDTPPPTVSGVLHMGHIFSYTQADFIARYQRMKGKSVFYPMGFDDNGLPTERLVEKTIKKRATDMSREEFIIECEKVVKGAEEEFRALFRSVALSVDWRQEYQTISAESRKISQLSFLDLYNKDRAYRKLQPMLWDPVDQTAIAQAEVEDKELASFANYIPFGIVGENENPEEIKWGKIEKVTVMTTRPELLAACVALMCHPDDAAKYKGKMAITPLFGVKVPIIADEKVDKEKGTGVVMCCTFGDETDIAWWKKYNLPLRIVLNKYGKLDLSGDWLKADKDRAYCSTLEHKLKDLHGKKVSNADPKHPGAREITIALLKENNLLLKQDPITHAVKCAERSGAPLEYLETHQWFVKILDQKEELKKKGKECNWHPEYMRIRLEQWIDGLNWDWCISRQRYFGVPFPIWFSKRPGEEGKIIVASADQLPVNPLVDLPKGYTKDEVDPEMDVMDTWATSSISPQLNSKGINSQHSALSTQHAFVLDESRHSRLFPADLRPQAHEIIRTWAFYTIVKAHLHENTIPWKNLMISGWCLASDKTKMSKSKGNVITPVELIRDQSADAVRFWASTSKLGTDTAFSEDVLKIGKKLVNKLWNATKFASTHFHLLCEKGVTSTAAEDIKNGVITEALDKWIITRLARAIKKADAEFAQYEYSNARAATEDFFWNDFCDNYLEMVKVRAYGNKVSEENTENRKPNTEYQEKQMSAVHTLYHCLEGVLRLFAPFVPHITEELYSHLFDNNYGRIGSLHARGTWPDANNYPIDEEAEQVGITAIRILQNVRELKALEQKSLKWPLEELSIISAQKKIKDRVDSCMFDLKSVTNSKKINWSQMPNSQDEDTIKVTGIFAAESDAA